MNRKIIYVVSYVSKWKVKCDHCKEVVKDTQMEAIKVARKHVADLPEGTLAQILVQRDDGKFREEWTYRKDPFPPRG